ncbi:lipocalin family protein [Mesorhizobium quangtriensis]
MTFLPEFVRWIPFTKGDYWVLNLADDYLVSLVGTSIADFCGCFRKLLR